MDYLSPTIKSDTHMELIQSLVSAIKLVASKYYANFRPSLVYNTKSEQNVTYTERRLLVYENL